MHDSRATRIELLSSNARPMRAFHVTWAAFFLCFFAWFGIAPLMESAIASACARDFAGAFAWPTALPILGVGVTATSLCAFLGRFSPVPEAAFRSDLERLRATVPEAVAIEREVAVAGEPAVN